MVRYTKDCVITRFHCSPNSVKNTPVRFGPNELPIRMPGQVNAPLQIIPLLQTLLNCESSYSRNQNLMTSEDSA